MKYIVVFLFSIQLITAIGQTNVSKSTQEANPETTNLVSQINKDSITNIIQGLQNFGSRFCLNDNNREIAVWLQNKFISYGYTNAVLDSFYMVKEYYDIVDSSWQYNVVATLEGTLSPDVYYLMGGHYDSYSSVLTDAPGADDNASGTAATLEVARVLKQNNFQPERSIVFIAFGAEELMLFNVLNGDENIGGSANYAYKAYSNNMDIRMMINNDMISYNSSGNTKIRLINPIQDSWVPEFASEICSTYTNLEMEIVYDPSFSSDHYPFSDKGYKSIFIQEYIFDPNYHTPQDRIENHDMDYCTEVTKISCAMLADVNRMPLIPNLQALSGLHKITLTWEEQQNIQGFNLYRSDTTDSNFVLINSTIITDSFYIDSSVDPNRYYYYKITSVNNNGTESLMSNEVKGMRIEVSFEKDILIIDDSKNELLYPSDSIVDSFYNSLFENYNYENYDATINTSIIELTALGEYKNIIWHVDKYSVASVFYKSVDEVRRYLDAGGNLLLTSEKISSTVEHYFSSTPKIFEKGDFSFDYLKIKELNKNTSARFIGAQSSTPSYNSIYIDTNKTPDTYFHHINYVETIYPTNEGNIIYTYDSDYDTTLAEGAFYGLPVGVEYKGEIYNVVSLSFPLYYMKFEDAKSLIDTIFSSTFIPNNTYKQNVSLPNEDFRIYPNPTNDNILIDYSLNNNSTVEIDIYDSFGNLVKNYSIGKQSAGRYAKRIDIHSLSSGIYFCAVKTNENKKILKLIKL